MPKPPQIVAMGGGGFSMEPDNLLLDRFVLSIAIATAPQPKVCFVGTASGDAQSYVDKFYAAFNTLPCTPTDLSLFKPPTTDLRSFVLEQDVIYVGGGNTRNLLVLWQEWGLDSILREAWLSGIVMAGISAGSICWFQQGLSDSVIPGDLAPLKCLGFLPGSNCPHYDGEPERRPAYHRFIGEGTLDAGYAADDGAALHFIGRELKGVVSSRPAAKAYSLRRVGTEVEEAPLDTVWLGSTAFSAINTGIPSTMG
ncbi:MAG: peptidase E [Terracidiphilus sp.]